MYTQNKRMDHDALLNLRTAVEFSPENIPLRLILAQTLLSAMAFAEAEEEYKKVVALSPGNITAKCGLARACYEQKKFQVACVILEDICMLDDTPAESLLMLARLLLAENDADGASIQYRRAIFKDKKIQNKELDLMFSSDKF